MTLSQPTQVELVALLFARVLLKRPEGLRGRLHASPRRQSLLLLLEAQGGGATGVRGGGTGGGTEAEQPLSVRGSQQLHD